MKYIYKNEQGQEEVVPLERWVWGVVYNDGTELQQFSPDGNFHRIGEIDQEKAILYVLYKPEQPEKQIQIVPQKGTKIIHKYRNIRPAGRTDFIRIYIFGTHYHINGEAQYHYNYVLPDDRIIQSREDNLDLTKFGL